MKRAYLYILAAAVLLGACQHSTPEEPKAPTPPEAYLSLIQAIEENKAYLSCKSISSATKIFFADGSSIIAKKGEMEISDCTENTPEEVSYDNANGMWYIGGKESGIKRINGPDKEAFPFYSYYDQRYLKVFASNGSVLELDNGYEEEPEAPQEPENPQEPDEPQEPEVPAVPYSIPTVYITTDGGAPIVSKEDYVTGTLKVLDPSKKFADEETFEARMKIRGRGNTSWGTPKKPYRIKLDEKASILGLKKNKNWVLLANYNDKTLMRNLAAMEMSRIVGMSWTPDFISVEVYLNNDYQGVYIFGDHKEVAKNRVNIEVVTPEDNAGEAVTGGYYLELEDLMDEPVCFKTARYGLPVNFHEPESPTEQQLAYIKNYFDEAETAIHNIQYEKDYTTWRKYVDEASLIKYYIVEEIAKDPDGNMRKSTFFTKERNKPLELYHVWDFDITMGNCNYTGFDDPTGWQMKGCVWYNKLFQDPEFTKAVKAKWNEVYPKMLKVTDYVNGQIDLLDGAQNRNFQKWDILGIYVWPNAVWLGDYEKEVAYFYNYLDKRLEWLNSEISKW